MSKLTLRGSRKFVGVCWIFALCIVSLCSGLFYYWSDDQDVSSQTKIIAAAFTAPEGPSPKSVDPVDQLLLLMTIEEKVGQMFVFGFNGIEPDKNILSAIRDKKIGGVILYDRNMQNPRQVVSLNNALKRTASEQRLEIPLFICVDQEGGNVTRMANKVSVAPAQQKQGMRAEREGVYSMAGVTAVELKAMGFSVNFAPVLDLSERDSRSFGTNPEKAASFGKAAVDAYNEAGIIASIKHFPGLGRSTVDTHFDFDVVKTPADILEKSDIIPFAHVMQTTDQRRFMLMTTHLIFTAYDSKNPSSVSPAVIKGLLRDKMGFSGLVVTDDMEMGGLSKIVSFDEMGEKAVAAGVDILLVCQEKENQDRVYQGLINAVKSGKISRSRIDESVRRILRTKQAYRDTLSQLTDAEAAQTVVGSARHKEIMKNFGKMTPQ